MGINHVSVIILVKNPREIFHRTLDSVKDFNEVIIVNTGSKESLIPFIRDKAHIKVFEKQFSGFGTLKQFAENQTSNHWILSLDSDEVLSDEAKQTLLNLDLNKARIYSFPFHNYLYDKWIKGCDWYPDRHIRLYNKTVTGFSHDKVHEKILEKNLKITRLKSPIYHYSYQGLSDFLDKMQRYSTLFVESKAKKSRYFFLKAIFGSLFTFCKSYFFQKGFLYGASGFIISMYKSQVSYYKYLKCWEHFKDEL